MARGSAPLIYNEEAAIGFSIAGHDKPQIVG
jgi:hypothetical protein